MAERFRLMCVASTPGFYGGMMHYPAKGMDAGHKRAGKAFMLQADGLRYDQDGRLEVNKQLQPILPKWVIPQEPVKPIDPKAVPHVVVAETKPKKGGRARVAAVIEVAPQAWPANSQKRLGLDDEREIKIKRAGTTAMLDREEDNGE